jgi:hypothetical protein
MFRPGRADLQEPKLPGPFGGIVYLDFLAELVGKRGVRTYLEIGVHFGHMLSRIACDTAIGVDPGYIIDTNVAAGKRRTLLYQCTSDRFFADANVQEVVGGPVEFAFLDGLHQFEYLLRDIANTEAVCGRDSLIALHDCMPLNPEMADRDGARERTDVYSKMWTGDVWKIVPILRKYRPDLDIVLVDCPPTGIVCLTGLDPGSTVLRDRYLDIVREFRDVPNGEAEIAAMYARNPITSSRAILNGFDQSLFFRA